MTVPTPGSDLLAFADDVARAPAPRVAAVRRAVSAAYYALFSTVHVKETVGQARAAVDDLLDVVGDRVTDNYLTLILGGPRFPARN